MTHVRAWLNGSQINDFHILRTPLIIGGIVKVLLNEFNNDIVNTKSKCVRHNW